MGTLATKLGWGRLWRGSRRRVVLVHQMGKVGSRSIVAALEGRPGLQVLHTHALNRDSLASLRAYHAEHRQPVPPHVRTAERVLDDLLTPGAPLDVVTVVREPCGRNISAFFQNLPFFAGRGGGDVKEEDAEALIARFLAEYHHGTPLRWFDLQVKAPLGLDVFAQPFPHDAGWQVIEHGPRRMLVLRCESDDAVKLRALRAFLGVEIDALPQLNVGDRKRYGEAYAAFKQRIRLPADYVDRMLDSAYARHFYTPAELAGFRERWLGVREPAAVAASELPPSADGARVAPVAKPGPWEPAAVVVHQVGKVGSQTLYHGLKAVGRWPVYQTHVLNSGARYFRDAEAAPPAGKSTMPPHLLRSREVRDRYLDAGRPLAVMTLVREPVSRNVSAFFQNLHRFPELDPAAPDADVDRFIAVFLSSYQHEEPVRWFDREFREPFGVDVFAHPFPHEAQHVALERPPHRFLLMRTELDDDAKRDLVARFLGLDTLTLEHRNVGEEKAYAELYRRFKERLRLPAEYVDGMLASRYATHFWSDEERRAIRDRWVSR